MPPSFDLYSFVILAWLAFILGCALGYAVGYFVHPVAHCIEPLIRVVR